MSTARCLLIMLVATAEIGLAQDSARAAPGAGPFRQLRVFFDCNADCDDNYIRTETPWIAFVRDRTDADVHLLITSLDTGGGGEEYTLNFIGAGPFAGRNDTLKFVSLATDTEDEGRRGLTRAIQLGIAPFIARTPLGRRLRMQLDDDDREGDRPTGPDRWRNWLFELEAEASFDEEQRQSELDWGGSFDARRITAGWKIGASSNVFFNKSRFTIEEDSATREIVNVRENYNGGVVLVRSHGAHWGSGVQLSVSSSTFSNTRLAVRAAPAVEFSIFPYDEFTRRQLTLQYSLGVSSFRYREQTIFGRFEETRPTHALVLGYDVNQPWGSADVTMETASYLDNSRQWRLEFDGEIDVRIRRGLSIEVGGNASLIRDQLGITARDATPEEILLELRDLQTDYRYNARIGISYSFGSIFSSIVNPRFGTGPGTILR